MINTNSNTSRQFIYGLLLGVILTLSTNSFRNWLKRKNGDGNKRELNTPQQPIDVISEDIVDGIEGLIGNTPLMRIKSLSDATGCEILGKAEFLNPGGSPKDRVALNMIKEAERKKLVKPNKGCTIFEGTSAKEKYQILEKLGATVEKVKPASIVDKNQFVNLAKRRAEEFGNNKLINEGGSNEATGFFTDQFENLSNYEAHYQGTGPELFRQTNGKIDAIVSGAGKDFFF
ncbi:15288_t:CDS:2 [Funneliformis geosporum]|uniref:cysteine synthase n=1 Tax=Funneliformis geosporum TaxID=1117311 RepID=A0A9W4X1P6_9GLOM|nr:4491_t:CDS:2 [Funneliformis geosporum]CAI2183059.1 15288_t:CDS:2 [Funneliformis geosporum]